MYFDQQATKMVAFFWHDFQVYKNLSDEHILEENLLQKGIYPLDEIH